MWVPACSVSVILTVCVRAVWPRPTTMWINSRSLNSSAIFFFIYLNVFIFFSSIRFIPSNSQFTNVQSFRLPIRLFFSFSLSFFIFFYDVLLFIVCAFLIRHHYYHWRRRRRILRRRRCRRRRRPVCDIVSCVSCVSCVYKNIKISQHMNLCVCMSSSSMLSLCMSSSITSSHNVHTHTNSSTNVCEY